jgi:hypothetical protein
MTGTAPPRRINLMRLLIQYIHFDGILAISQNSGSEVLLQRQPKVTKTIASTVLQPCATAQTIQ